MSRIKRRSKQPGVYFVTTATWQRRRLFAKPEPANIVLDHLLTCREKGFHKLHAFVLMPDHLHLLLTPAEDTSLERALMMIKGGSSFRIKRELLYSSPIWASGYHDRWIRDVREYRMRRQYIELNPLKEQLATTPADYAFGSAGGNCQLDPCDMINGA